MKEKKQSKKVFFNMFKFNLLSILKILLENAKTSSKKIIIAIKFKWKYNN
jgi:hypothetical protein